MKNLLEKLDYFGKTVLFSYKGSSKSKSRVGAIFTICLLGFAIWMIYNFGQDIFRKEDPKATASESFSADPAPMVLTPETFNFAFGVADPFTFVEFINESIFTVEADLYRSTRESLDNGTLITKYEYIPLELERCTKDHFAELGESFPICILMPFIVLGKNNPMWTK